MDVQYDRFLHSYYSNPKVDKSRVAILKSDIVGYEEHGLGTKIFSKESEFPIEIIMNYDEVKKSLTTADISV